MHVLHTRQHAICVSLQVQKLRAQLEAVQISEDTLQGGSSMASPLPGYRIDTQRYKSKKTYQLQCEVNVLMHESALQLHVHILMQRHLHVM